MVIMSTWECLFESRVSTDLLGKFRYKEALFIDDMLVQTNDVDERFTALEEFDKKSWVRDLSQAFTTIGNF